jgi:MYXO-CTERM domain-containing protein
MLGCAEQPAVAGQAEPVVYGEDDRTDVYAHPDATLRSLAHESIVALMDTSDLTANGSGGYDRAPALTLEEAFGLCDTERFLDQPTSAFCSGTLIAPDVVVTAGHCIEDASDCAGTSFVFDARSTADGVLDAIATDDVYSCAEILSREDGALDYAYLRLDRPVVGHSPAPVAAGVGTTCRNVVDDEAVTVLGFGSGLPLKIDSGGTVTDASVRGTNFFNTSLDTFGGNSGSGVFNGDGELVGVLSSGLQDYITAPSGTCDIVNTLPNNQGGEEIGHLLPTLQRYCATDSPNAALCALADNACDPVTTGDAGIVTPPSSPDDGCGCRVVGTQDRAPAPGLLALLGLAGVVLTRRVRQRKSRKSRTA